MTVARTIMIGTRGSPLALVQAQRIAGMLQKCRPGCSVAVRPVATRGDRVSDWASVRDETGIFVRELETELREGKIDLAVHSVKDMPSSDAPGLALAAVPERENPQDVLISRDGRKFHELSPGSVVGTSSIRRKAQVLRRRGDLAVAELRGNVETRVRKVREGLLDATVLAAAGVLRLGMADRIAEYLPLDWMLPAPCQGALGAEVRADDGFMRVLAQEINDPAAFACIRAERAFLRRLGAGCRVPVSALARTAGGEVHLRGGIFDEGSPRAVEADDRSPAADADALGERLAETLLGRGGEDILKKVKI